MAKYTTAYRSRNASSGCLFSTLSSLLRLFLTLILLSVQLIQEGGRRYHTTALSRKIPYWLVLLLAVSSCGVLADFSRNSQQARQPQTQTQQPQIIQLPTMPPKGSVKAHPTDAPTRTVGGTGVQDAPAQDLTEARVIRVIDGDTIEVEFKGGGGRLRLIGVDTPETKHPSKPVQCFGKEAGARTQALIDEVGGQVYIEKDISERDRYGRLLRYVWLPYPQGLRMLDETLVKEGYAQVSTYPPDVKYVERFTAAQTEARRQNRGLWGVCGEFGLPVSVPTQRVGSALPALPTPTIYIVPTHTLPVQAGEYSASASVSHEQPTKNTRVTVTGRLFKAGQPVEGATLSTSWHYKTTTSGCSGKSDASGKASCTRSIGPATSGYRVIIDVIFTTPDGRQVTTQTSFITR